MVYIDPEVQKKRARNARNAVRQARWRERQKDKLPEEVPIVTPEEFADTATAAIREAIAANTTTDPDRKFGLGHKVGLQHALRLVEDLKRELKCQT